MATGGTLAWKYSMIVATEAEDFLTVSTSTFPFFCTPTVRDDEYSLALFGFSHMGLKGAVLNSITDPPCFGALVLW